MAIQFPCSCGRKLQAQDEHAGRQVKCPDCGALLTVPPGPEAVQTEGPPKPGPVQASLPRRAEVVDDEPEEERPRRRSRADHEDDDERRGEAERTSGKAVAALVLGLLSFCLSIFTGIPAMILAFMSLGDIKRSQGRLGGQGLAIAGLILGCISLVLVTPAILIGLLVPAVQKVREAASQSASRLQSSNNLKQIALAIVNDADTNHGRMVAPAIYDKNGKPLLSWRVAILPYIEEGNLYKQFKLDEPWDGPNNSKLIPLMPRVYAHPADPAANADGLTHYRVFTGPHTPFPEPPYPDPQPPLGGNRSSMRFPASFTDGTSFTILVVEATDAVTWTKPDELPYDPNKPLPQLGLQPARGFNVAMADGSVRFVSASVSDQTKRAAITPADGEVLGPDW